MVALRGKARRAARWSQHAGESAPSGLRLVFIANVDWFLLSHRAHLVRRAIAEGYHVEVWCGDTGRMADISALGAGVRTLPLRRGGTRPIPELWLIIVLLTHMLRWRPDVVQNVSVKPVLYGTLVARVTRRPRIINAVSGFGYAVEGSNAPRVLAAAVLLAYRLVLRTERAITVFQNADAMDCFCSRGIVRKCRARVVLGSGVDLAEFRQVDEPTGMPVVMFASRMLWDKGLDEFVRAAALVRTTHRARFVLVGAPDPENRASATAAWIDDVVSSGVCEWWGHRAEMADVLAKANLVVLPSHHEGLPKVLVEAAAVGRSVVASDIPGCRAIVVPGKTGVLVPVRDSRALALAIAHELDNPATRSARGRAAAEHAQIYSTARVQADFVALWSGVVTAPATVDPVGMTGPSNQEGRKSA